MATVSINYSSYNDRRYSKPWGAVVTLDGVKPVYDFKAGYYAGDDSGGKVMITCQPGNIVASGQKDNRNTRKTANDWYLVGDDGSLQDIDRAAAIEYLLANN